MKADSEEKQPFVVEMARHAIGSGTNQPAHVPFSVVLPVWWRHASAWFSTGTPLLPTPYVRHHPCKQAPLPRAGHRPMRSATWCAVR